MTNSECPIALQTFAFQMETLFFTVNYSMDKFFKNVDIHH